MQLPPHTHLRHYSGHQTHNFYDGKWSIYLDFPCKFIVLFSLIFLPFIVTTVVDAAVGVPAAVAVVVVVAIQFDFRRHNIYLFIFIIWFIHRTKKFNFNICVSHIAHFVCIRAYTVEWCATRIECIPWDGWDIRTRFPWVGVRVMCIYYLAIAFLIIRLCKVFARDASQCKRPSQ